MGAGTGNFMGIDEQLWLERMMKHKGGFYAEDIVKGTEVPLWAQVERRPAFQLPIVLQYVSEWLDFRPQFAAYRCIDAKTCESVIVYFWNETEIAFTFVDGRDLQDFVNSKGGQNENLK